MKDETVGVGNILNDDVVEFTMKELYELCKQRKSVYGVKLHRIMREVTDSEYQKTELVDDDVYLSARSFDIIATVGLNNTDVPSRHFVDANGKLQTEPFTDDNGVPVVQVRPGIFTYLWEHPEGDSDEAKRLLNLEYMEQLTSLYNMDYYPEPGVFIENKLRKYPGFTVMGFEQDGKKRLYINEKFMLRDDVKTGLNRIRTPFV